MHPAIESSPGSQRRERVGGGCDSNVSTFTDLAPEHEAFLDAWEEGNCPLPAEPSSTTWNRPLSVWRHHHVMALVAGDSLAMALAAWVADAVRFGAQDGVPCA